MVVITEKLKIKIFSMYSGSDADRAAEGLTKLVNDWVTEKNKISVEDIEVHTQPCQSNFGSAGSALFFIATVKYTEEP